MADEKTCPKCGAPLPPNAPRGVCPQCLLALGIPTTGSPTIDRSTTPRVTTPAPAFIPPEPAELAEQFPQLEIIELLGAGGMGAVYKARQKQLDRLVALKILPPQVAQDPAFAERFSREARSMAQLNHPNIVTLYEFGTTDDGIYYFLMEYVDGTDLRQVINARVLTPAQALKIVPQICEALNYAHAKSVIHRDIKPENVLLTADGVVKIADFGLARILQQRPENQYTLTQTHQVMGTPHYMAPEQIDGAHTVDHRADIYSLGVVFYEMLTGQLPLGHFEPPSHKVHVDIRLDTVVLKTLAREPQRRYQHASEVKTDVQKIAVDKAHAVYQRPDSTSRRFCRSAIVGIFWAPLVLFLFDPLIPFMRYVNRAMESWQQEEASGPPMFLIVTSPLLLLAISAPVATTALGLISIAKIRQSSGALYGMVLAVVDTLLFPMTILSLFIVGLPAANDIQHRLQPPLNTYAVYIAILLCPVIDILIIRWVWRKANAGLQGLDQSGSAPQSDLTELDRPASVSRTLSVLRLIVIAICIFGSTLILFHWRTIDAVFHNITIDPQYISENGTFDYRSGIWARQAVVGHYLARGIFVAVIFAAVAFISLITLSSAKASPWRYSILLAAAILIGLITTTIITEPTRLIDAPIQWATESPELSAEHRQQKGTLTDLVFLRTKAAEGYVDLMPHIGPAAYTTVALAGCLFVCGCVELVHFSRLRRR